MITNVLNTYTFALAVVGVACSVRAWDLGVVTPTQIQFLSRKIVESTAADRLKNMMAVAYDPITTNMYVNDGSQKVGSIFRIKTVDDAAYTVVEPIVAKQSTTVQGIAFDHHTSTLYWTTGNGLTINFVHVPENVTANKELLPSGNVLLRFNQEIPQGIAIDTCRGYLYWTNCNHLNATIERSRLDGSDRQLVVHERLFQPLSVAVDVEENRVYWSNEREGMYYSVESSDPDGGNRKTLIHGTHHQPFSIVLNDRDVYWSDWTNNAVWTMPKDGDKPPELVVKYDSINTPMGLIMPTGNATRVNDSYCAMARPRDVAVPTTELTPELIPYDVLRNICKNKGVLHANGTCTCPAGFVGEYCQTGVCDGYCVTGTCTVSAADGGRPTCRCPVTNHGDRCEKQPCSGRCLNGGDCEVDRNGSARCLCATGYTGDSCQFKSAVINEMCSVYCQYSASNSICRCEEYGGNNNRQFADYSEMAMVNHSDAAASCKVSKGLTAVVAVLTVFVVGLATVALVLSRKVRSLGRRPRIKKRIVVNKSITPLTCRPQEQQQQHQQHQQQQQNQQCEITIENCCNMNICETPCFEPDYRQSLPKLPSLSRSKKEDKANLLGNTDGSSEDEKPLY